MATRPPASARTARRGAKTAAAEPAPPAQPEPAPPAAGLLQALKAIGEAQGAAVTRHSRVFESLLGIDPDAPRKELFKLPTFEDLFDERVARSLERLGTTRALAELQQQLAAIDKRLRRIERTLEPRAPRRR